MSLRFVLDLIEKGYYSDSRGHLCRVAALKAVEEAAEARVPSEET